jgi:hypothetical protein
VFDGPVAELTDAKVREIYGAEEEFEEATTSTAIPGREARAPAGLAAQHAVGTA